MNICIIEWTKICNLANEVKACFPPDNIMLLFISIQQSSKYPKLLSNKSILSNSIYSYLKGISTVNLQIKIYMLKTKRPVPCAKIDPIIFCNFPEFLK